MRKNILIKNDYLQFFKLEVMNNNGEIPSLNQLIHQLEIILSESEMIGPAVGILSSDNRDNWSKGFQELVKGKGQNDL